MPATLEHAIAVVRQSYGEQRWLSLDTTEQTRAIYREIRRLDLEETMTRRALARSSDSNGQAAAEPQAAVASEAGFALAAEPLRCSAFIKTRVADRCTWQPVVVHDGRPYCGFHNPQRHRPRSPHAVAAATDGKDVPDMQDASRN